MHRALLRRDPTSTQRPRPPIEWPLVALLVFLVGASVIAWTRDRSLQQATEIPPDLRGYWTPATYQSHTPAHLALTADALLVSYSARNRQLYQGPLHASSSTTIVGPYRLELLEPGALELSLVDGDQAPQKIGRYKLRARAEQKP